MRLISNHMLWNCRGKLILLAMKVLSYSYAVGFSFCDTSHYATRGPSPETVNSLRCLVQPVINLKLFVSMDTCVCLPFIYNEIMWSSQFKKVFNIINVTALLGTVRKSNLNLLLQQRCNSAFHRAKGLNILYSQQPWSCEPAWCSGERTSQVPFTPMGAF